MAAFEGFEPQVGEIRALRTFRIGPNAMLFPLFSDSPWLDGTNSSRCAAGLDHVAPDGDCTCGFYAYADEDGAREHPHSRHVLAVVACWGGIIAGTRGIRAQHGRVEALWMSPTVPVDLAHDVALNYPSVAIFDDRMAMLASHPPTALDCYEPPASRPLTAGVQLAIVAAAALGCIPANWILSTQQARILWAAELFVFLAGAALVALVRREARTREAALVFIAATLWLIAPFAGVEGTYLLRLPIIQITSLGLLHRIQLHRAARRFPARIGPEDRSR